ncbi:hypothetical protein L6R52_12280 [Myxococcota bacterium]|nr:hypothetical protein [Myxococcota bacterium]
MKRFITPSVYTRVLVACARCGTASATDIAAHARAAFTTRFEPRSRPQDPIRFNSFSTAALPRRRGVGNMGNVSSSTAISYATSGGTFLRKIAGPEKGRWPGGQNSKNDWVKSM